MKTKTTIANTILSLLCFLFSTIIYGQNSPENTINIAGDAIINPTFEASLHEIVWNQEVLTRSLPSSVDNSSLMEGYMPPIFDQGYSSSCVQCAEIGYVYTYELNRYKHVSAGSHWHNGIETDMQNLYHRNETAIQNSEILAALAGTFANKCDELQEHYDEAIAWYEPSLRTKKRHTTTAFSPQSTSATFT